MARAGADGAAGRAMMRSAPSMRQARRRHASDGAAPDGTASDGAAAIPGRTAANGATADWPRQAMPSQRVSPSATRVAAPKGDIRRGVNPRVGIARDQGMAGRRAVARPDVRRGAVGVEVAS